MTADQTRITANQIIATLTREQRKELALLLTANVRALDRVEPTLLEKHRRPWLRDALVCLAVAVSP